MVSSQNTRVELSIPATSMAGLAVYGTVLLGDRAFEFYNSKNPRDYIQIPWSEISYISASVLFGGKYISRFMIVTNHTGQFIFSTRNNKQVLRGIRDHIGEQRLRRSPSAWQVVCAGIRALFSGITKR